MFHRQMFYYITNAKIVLFSFFNKNLSKPIRMFRYAQHDGLNIEFAER